MCSCVIVAAFKSVNSAALSRGWPLSSTARRSALPVIIQRKLLKLMLHLNTVLTSACLGSKTATTNMRCNRLSNILASAVTCSSKKNFPAPVTNQAVGDLSELWSYGIYHSSVSVCPALPTSIRFCPDAAKEESDLLLSGPGRDWQSHPNETIILRGGLHFYSCFCRNLKLDCFLLWLRAAPGAVCSSLCFQPLV